MSTPREHCGLSRAASSTPAPAKPGIPETRSVITGNGPTTIANSLFHNCANPSTAVLSFSSTTSPEFRTVVNCTFSGNSVRTIVETWGLAAVNVRNTIVWGNTHSQPAFTGAAVVQYSNIQGGWSGTGNINVNPIFKAAGQGDYRLSAGSPCIDRADASALPPGITLDLAGKPRFFDDPLTSNVNAAGTPPYLDLPRVSRTLCLPARPDHHRQSLPPRLRRARLTSTPRTFSTTRCSTRTTRRRPHHDRDPWDARLRHPQRGHQLRRLLLLPRALRGGATIDDAGRRRGRAAMTPEASPVGLRTLSAGT